MDQPFKGSARARVRKLHLIAGITCGIPIGIGLGYGRLPEAQPVLITHDYGGNAVQHDQWADRVSGRTVVIAGPCASSCTLMVAYGRRNACVTPSASLGFHLFKTSGPAIQPRYASDVQAWIEGHGGLGPDLIWMRWPETGRHFRVCTKADWA